MCQVMGCDHVMHEPDQRDGGCKTRTSCTAFCRSNPAFSAQCFQRNIVIVREVFQTCWLTESMALQLGCTKKSVCCTVCAPMLEAAVSWLESGRKAGSRNSDKEGLADVPRTRWSWLMTASSAAAAAVIWRPGDALELAALRAPFWDACMQLKLQVVRRPFCSDQSDQRPSRRPCMAAHLSPRCEADGRQGYRSQLQAALHGTSWQPRLRQAPSACRTRVVRHLHRPSKYFSCVPILASINAP